MTVQRVLRKDKVRRLKIRHGILLFYFRAFFLICHQIKLLKTECITDTCFKSQELVALQLKPISGLQFHFETSMYFKILCESNPLENYLVNVSCLKILRPLHLECRIITLSLDNTFHFSVIKRGPVCFYYIHRNIGRSSSLLHKSDRLQIRKRAESAKSTYESYD